MGTARTIHTFAHTQTHYSGPTHTHCTPVYATESKHTPARRIAKWSASFATGRGEIESVRGMCTSGNRVLKGGRRGGGGNRGVLVGVEDVLLVF